MFTSLWGKSAFLNMCSVNGTGMNKNMVMRNTQPVTTPRASGLRIRND